MTTNMEMCDTTGHKDKIKKTFKNFRVKAGNIWMRTNNKKNNRKVH
jgi:hypothetical protein